MYDIRSGYLQDVAIHSRSYTRKNDVARQCFFRAYLDVSDSCL